MLLQVALVETPGRKKTTTSDPVPEQERIQTMQM